MVSYKFFPYCVAALSPFTTPAQGMYGGPMHLYHAASIVPFVSDGRHLSVTVGVFSLIHIHYAILEYSNLELSGRIGRLV